jgi:hypothetical protein
MNAVSRGVFLVSRVIALYGFINGSVDEAIQAFAFFLRVSLYISLFIFGRN